MIRRIVSFFCVFLMLASVFPAAAEETHGRHHYDFDLTFSLDPDSFPELLRSRASGYADLLSRLGIRGDVAWNDDVKSMDMNATLYYRDNSSLTYPFRFYGTKKRLFITSPLINKQVLLFNMAALMEFAVKAKNTLGVTLPYLAVFYPYATEYVFLGMTAAWKETVGAFRESGTIPLEQFQTLSGLWTRELANNPDLQRWIMAIDSGSEVTGIVESEFNKLPRYYQAVTGEQPVTVTLGEGSETWQDSTGKMLFSREESDGSLTVKTDLPASENGYIPSLSYARTLEGDQYSIDLSASVCLDKNSVHANTEAGAAEDTAESGQDSESEDDMIEDDYAGFGSLFSFIYGGGSNDDVQVDRWPETLLKVTVKGSGIPARLPADSSFTVSVSVLGTVYPNYAFLLKGSTTAEGDVSLTLCKPAADDAEPVGIFRISGTVHPLEPVELPNYQKKSLKGSYNVFSFNEQRLSEFSTNVLPYLIRSILSFVEAAPASACQSFLDDLTDIGILDMLIQY